ncbi:hypothetical protein QBC34DRAFT_478502 [Podospora aff. communis PSN243]|uniref:Uncharacterized protein n=1 Tax=Podospora aff. communis PSN243 TaxID=3040156 RepID=A0AAV9G5J1_9PEZI|nr:hypothetical protein QBC34DRAFT_478502 [Podospora aff. communis PSN243]
MRTSSFLAAVLQAHWLLLTPASAYGARGYAERALYFLVYQMEEIHPTATSGSGWKIAPGCKGARRGIFAKDRCNLAEFVDHIWAPMDGETEANRPDKSKITWGNAMKSAKEANVIMSLLTSATINKIPLTETGTSGYQGKLDVQNKLWPGSGITDYYTSLGAFGERAAQLNAEMDKAVADGVLGDPDKPPTQNAGESDADFKARKTKWDGQSKRVTQFRKLFSESKTAALTVQNMRMKDSWNHIEKDVDWKSKLGVNPVWDTHNEGRPNVGEWKTINEAKTIEEMVKSGMTKDAAQAKFDSVWAEVTSTDSYKQHRAAIVNAQKTMRAMGMEGRLTVENCNA